MFASREKPLRISSLPSLITCPMRAVLLDEGLFSDESGAAADTGSLLHAYAAAWHTNGKNEAEAVSRVDATASGKFPKADPEQAREWFAAYAADPRNRDAVILAIEQPVELVLPPAENDPTGEPVYFRGTLDQIREDDDGERVWDLKTGRAGGVAMFDSYSFQLAGYTLAAAAYLGRETMRPPGVIRLQGYKSRDGGTHFRSALTWRRCQMLMQEIVGEVARIRAGDVAIRPGFHCSTICPARGLQTCLPLADRLAGV